ncbi:12-oxophytodienoate reductase [Mesorhizobium kowhaii]|uniref:NADH:flavin oxidoreductase/NADH oxidase N-terminal domain-containing protein n=1 Tax=Mesorhizobium kowhaii TaxID=1300272 RepID=A0A2W7C6J1_9HYPH|nr:12-oxophytodienoate reductase [Mesorhizobium kowhaii]PZV38785.1 hypothetical protein B5V02_09010 [Mesorhizobium kowhaii]
MNEKPTAKGRGVASQSSAVHRTDVTPLFQPFSIRGLNLRNRFVMPSMQRGWAVNGHPPRKLGEYYAARVRGGVQLVISESIAIDHPSATRTSKYGRLAEDTVDEWARCVEAVHQAGGHIFLQIGHEGALRADTGDDSYAIHPTLSPSGLRSAGVAVGRAATAADLKSIRDAFVSAARLARRIGVDGIEIPACHGYLLDQFLWAETNHRDDEYGGPGIADRLRYPVEIVRSVRAEVGAEFPISLRFSQWKIPDQEARVFNSPEELGIMLNGFQEAGADLLHASSRRFWQPEWPTSSLSLAGWTKRLSGAPVIAVGSVGLDVDMFDTFHGKEGHKDLGGNIDELLRGFNAGEFDLVAVGRSTLADPDWVAKLRDGRGDEVHSFTIGDLGEIKAEAAAAGALST